MPWRVTYHDMDGEAQPSVAGHWRERETALLKAMAAMRDMVREEPGCWEITMSGSDCMRRLLLVDKISGNTYRIEAVIEQIGYYWRCGGCGFETPRAEETQPEEVGPCPRCSNALWLAKQR